MQVAQSSIFHIALGVKTRRSGFINRGASAPTPSRVSKLTVIKDKYRSPDRVSRMPGTRSGPRARARHCLTSATIYPLAGRLLLRLLTCIALLLLAYSAARSRSSRTKHVLHRHVRHSWTKTDQQTTLVGVSTKGKRSNFMMIAEGRGPTCPSLSSSACDAGATTVRLFKASGVGKR